MRELRTEQRLAVLPRDALGNLGREVSEPGTRPSRMLGHEGPALGRERVGTDQETVGEFPESGPLRLRYGRSSGMMTSGAAA